MVSEVSRSRLFGASKVAADTTGVGWRVKDGTYESAAYRFSLRPADGWRLALGGELIRAFRATTKSEHSGPRRTVGELRALAETERAKRQTTEAARAKNAKAAADAARQRHLTKLAREHLRRNDYYYPHGQRAPGEVIQLIELQAAEHPAPQSKGERVVERRTRG